MENLAVFVCVADAEAEFRTIVQIFVVAPDALYQMLLAVLQVEQQAVKTWSLRVAHQFTAGLLIFSGLLHVSKNFIDKSQYIVW